MKRKSKKNHGLNGHTVLEDLVKRAGYASLLDFVTQHTVFLPPETVRQIPGGQAVFRTVRNLPQRGQIIEIDGYQVLADDNSSCGRAFDWSADQHYEEYQYCHIWPNQAKNP